MHVRHMAAANLNLALVLHALLTERSVSRAARALGLSQSATSHSLARLRTLLRDPLFVRSPHGIIPTPRAEAIAESLSAGLTLLEQSLFAPPRFDPATTTRRFRVVATDYVEFLLLPRLFKALAKEAPKIDVWIRPFDDDATALLHRGDIDLVIGVPPYTIVSATLHTQPLLHDRFVCLVRDRHPLTRGRLTTARFAAANHLLIAPRGRPGGPIDEALAKRNVKRNITTAVPHFLAAPRIVAETDLVVTVAARIAAAFTTTKRLRRLELPFETPAIQVSMLWHDRHHADAAHAWFRARLAELSVKGGRERKWSDRQVRPSASPG
jgi:DNA-binding transcriptional LysR family regulator